MNDVKEQWRLRAACRGQDTEIWFPISDHLTAESLEFCLRCPVRAECLDYALVNNLHGIWGGTSEDHRRALQGRQPRNRRIQVLPQVAAPQGRTHDHARDRSRTA